MLELKIRLFRADCPLLSDPASICGEQQPEKSLPQREGAE
jgi:hypothetical protein